MSVRQYFKQDCELHTSTKTVDNGGAVVESFTKLRDFKGRIRMLGGRERLMNEKLGFDATHRLYLDKGITVELSDRVKCGMFLFDVISVNYLNDEADHIEVDLKLVIK